jgi:hydrogenase maturation protease
VERRVGQKNANGALDFVDELQLGKECYLAWEEATEREIVITGLRLPALEASRRVAIAIPPGRAEEPLTTPDGEEVGALIRSWCSLEGAIEVETTSVQGGLFKLAVKITNSTPWGGQDRETTLKQTFVSTHTVLTVEDGEFVSLTDPPKELKQVTEECKNIKTWPVLVGEEGDRHTMLSSPIILYDYPRIAPESPGNLFDGTEIDQLLILNILTLTDEEKAEMCASDPRAREILGRSESLTAEEFMRLHGAIREFRSLQKEEDISPFWESVERPVPQSVVVDGIEVKKGSKVRLRPRPGGDILDLALAGKVAFVEAIEQDYEDCIHLAVTLEEDPGRDLGVAQQPGHRFFFSPEEIEPLESYL